jgi:hypothetical protein
VGLLALPLNAALLPNQNPVPTRERDEPAPLLNPAGALIFLRRAIFVYRNMVRLKSPVTHRKQSIGFGFNRNTFGGSRFRFFAPFWRILIAVRAKVRPPFTGRENIAFFPIRTG